MGLVRSLFRAYLIDRMIYGGRRRRSRAGWYGPPRHRRSPRGRVGLFGPFPTYSTRTRRGSHVTVSGCCLPIPLGLLGLGALGARLLTRR